MVTLAPASPLVGAKPVIVGGTSTVKLLALVAVPPAVATLSGPVVAPVPLNVTAVTPVKSVPLIVTLAPAGPLVGAKPVIVGGTSTVKLLALAAVPPVSLPDALPIFAPPGTVA